MNETTKKQFDELKAKNPDAVLLFRVGDFYETYYDDAKTVSDVCGLTLTRVDSTFHYKEPAYMCGFPHHALDTYLPKLVRAGQRVAICDQLSEPTAQEPKTSQTLKPTNMERKNEIKNVPISAIQPSPRNPRKTFDEVSLQELADNIKQQGLLQPITVRPIIDLADQEGNLCKYEVVCGERRFRAVKMNGDETIPCIVRDLDDETAYEVMITENLQRKDIDPMEEAFAFNELVKAGKSCDEIAQRFGKPLRFVQSRVKLASLIPEAKKLVTDGKMDIGCAQIICKLNESDQKRFIEAYEYRGEYNKMQAKQFTDGIFRYLRNAPWDDDYTGGCNRKCADCPFNSNNAGCLFYDMSGDGRCTNAEQFRVKHNQFYYDLINNERDVLLRADEDFVKDGTCIVSSCSYGDKELCEKILKPFRDEGFKVVDRSDVFDWGELDEEDDAEEINENKDKMYRCVIVSSNYRGNLEVRIAWLDFKGEPEEVDPTAVEARKLVAKRDQLITQRSEAVLKALREEVIEKGTECDFEDLYESERVALCTKILMNLPFPTRHELGADDAKKSAKLALDGLRKDGDGYLFKTLRLFIQSYLMGHNDYEGVGRVTVEKVAEQWDYDKAVEAKAKAMHKFEKRIKDVESKLTALGYNAEGKKLDF